MRVLYGVCGEGMGHAVRSAVVARHLQDRGHGVLLAGSGGALEYLARRFERVMRVSGLSIVKERGGVQHLSTALSNLVRQGLDAFDDVMSGAEIALSERPDVVVSDFEPWSARLAITLGVPLVAVDSIHFLSRFRHPSRMVTVDAVATLPVVDAMVPFARRYLVAPLVTFRPVTPSEPRTSWHPPILRREVLAWRRVERPLGEHLTVYLNDLPSQLDALRQLDDYDQPVHVWGEPPPGAPHGAISYHPFDDALFLRDLATCRAAVGSAGALLGEAAILGRPMLSLPMRGHWEQHVNAAYHAEQGLGETCERLTSTLVHEFLERAPAYAENCRALPHDDNRSLLAALDHELEEVRR